MRAALRLVEKDGLEVLSLRRLAKQLGVSPATVHWHMRSKDELIAAIVNAVFPGFRGHPQHIGPVGEASPRSLRLVPPPAPGENQSVGCPGCQSVLPYAFTQVGIAGASILAEAGFAGEELSSANRALFMHTFGSVIHEASLLEAFSPTETPKQALDHALVTLRGEDVGRLVEHLPRMLDFDRDQLFEYSLGRLLEGLEARL